MPEHTPQSLAATRKASAANDFIFECQNCGKWNVNAICQGDGDGEAGCSEQVHLKRIRRWR